MSGDCQTLLLRAIRARMLADAGIAAEVGTRIFETVPANVVFPLITLNGATWSQNDTDTSSGATHEISYAVSTHGEDATVAARRIGKTIVDCLDRAGQFLAVAGHKVVLMRFVRNVVYRADDTTNGEGRGVYTFEVLTEQIAAASGY